MMVDWNDNLYLESNKENYKVTVLARNANSPFVGYNTIIMIDKYVYFASDDGEIVDAFGTKISGRFFTKPTEVWQTIYLMGDIVYVASNKYDSLEMAIADVEKVIPVIGFLNVTTKEFVKYG